MSAVRKPLLVRSLVIGSVLAAALAMSGCTPSTPEPTGSTAPTATPTQSSTPTPTPEPTLDPEGSAADNLPVFMGVVDDVWASEQRGSGRAYIDGLVAAGFDKAAMQVTEDMSTVGNPAESIEFSVFFKGECLVGQVGPTVPEPIAEVMPALPGDLCLIGVTRTIDW